MKYAFVECQRGQHSVRTLCRALHVSPSGYYAARSRPPSARDERQSSLTTKIVDVHLASRETYGAPRVHAELSIQGIACCRNTVAKLMRRAQIMPKAIRHFRVTTDSRNTKEVLPNLVKRCFKAKRPMLAGSATSLTSQHARAGCTWRRSSMCIPGLSWAGR